MIQPVDHSLKPPQMALYIGKSARINISRQFEPSVTGLVLVQKGTYISNCYANVTILLITSFMCIHSIGSHEGDQIASAGVIKANGSGSSKCH